MSTNTDIKNDHEWWEFFYEFSPEAEVTLETEEQARERVKKELNEAYERAMGVI